MNLTRISKILGGLVGILASVPITTLVPGINPALATLITGVLGLVGTYLAPRNTGKPTDPIYAEDVKRTP